MSEPFLKLIPAPPGWHVASIWRDDDDEPLYVEYEPIIAWAEPLEQPGQLVPIVRDGHAEREIGPLGDSDTFLLILAPGEAVDLVRHRFIIDSNLKRQEENRQREYEQQQRALAQKRGGGA